MRGTADARPPRRCDDRRLPLFWSAIWSVAALVADRAPLTASPANLWTETLLLAVAIDLARQHGAAAVGRKRSR